MQQKTKLIILIQLVTLLFVTCDRPACKNTNPKFDSYDITSLEYKTELIKQIEEIGQENLSYWFDSYVEENNREYIIVNIQDDSLCAKCKILVNKWDKLEGIKRAKGKSYEGAKLMGFTLRIEQDSNGIEFIYEDLIGIID